ncbi:uncharacterized protein [Hyperolius riggenbachi]|uniref:uncharacterized protein n=1 Tax=Hyperolius riggenbachi TaxID=752182 RepID=UPI0035A2B747
MGKRISISTGKIAPKTDDKTESLNFLLLPSTSSLTASCLRAGRDTSAAIMPRSFINVEDFIMAVQERPELYDKKNDLYSDLQHARRVWEEITKQFVPEYDKFPSRKQAKELEKMKTKWRSIRDSFVKELKVEKDEQRSGSGASKRTPYCHTRLLSFLRPLVQARGTEDNFDALMDDSNEAPAATNRDSSPEHSFEDLTTINVDDIVEDDSMTSESPTPSTSTPRPDAQPATDKANAETTRSEARRPAVRPTSARGQSRTANVQMAGAVSSLVGMMRNQESMVSRRLQDPSSGLSQQYLQHIEMLKNQLDESNQVLQKERQMFQEQIQSLHMQHRHEIDRIMQHQNSQVYYSVMSLLPFMEQVPRHRLIQCQCSLLECIKSHFEFSTATSRPPSAWQPSHTQPYQGPSPSQSYQSYQQGPSFPPSQADERPVYTQLGGSMQPSPLNTSPQQIGGNYSLFHEQDPKK